MGAEDIEGIHFAAPEASRSRDSVAGLQRRLDELGLKAYVENAPPGGADSPPGLRLRAGAAAALAPGADTAALSRALGLSGESRRDDLEREILLSMLLSPQAFVFPSFEELTSAVNVRMNIVDAARKTALAFDTARAERPEDCWTYDEGRGFTVLPGHDLATALRKATQPDVSGQLYSFSCYRATEYVILLAVAEELARVNPALRDRLQRQWESRAIRSGEFHEVFLHEYGTQDKPLPLAYYVPGDRVWFRNPDDASSDATGYEGSWVFYLGGGLFCNFWKRSAPYTLVSKCLELYHWRHAVRADSRGVPTIDEEVVEAHVLETLADPPAVERILKLMMRHRDGRGVNNGGGCVDTTREHPRRLCPGTTDLHLPEN